MVGACAESVRILSSPESRSSHETMRRCEFRVATNSGQISVAPECRHQTHQSPTFHFARDMRLCVSSKPLCSNNSGLYNGGAAPFQSLLSRHACTIQATNAVIAEKSLSELSTRVGVLRAMAFVTPVTSRPAPSCAGSDFAFLCATIYLRTTR